MIHFRPDGFELTRTACGLRPWEVEHATCVSEHVDCGSCNAWLDSRARRGEIDDFYAMDIEHDQGDPLWEDRRTRLGTYREQQNGGLSQADLPLTSAERSRLGIKEK